MFIALLSAFLLVILKNPIYSIFSLLISIISSVIVLLLSRVEFLAYVFLIVYVGAIAVLFLFVIMMLNIKESKNYAVDYSKWEFMWLVLLVPKFTYIIKLTIEDYLTFAKPQNIFINSEIDDSNIYINDIDVFSQLLYTHYFFVFILSSIVLLVSMIGALIITTNKTLLK